MPATKRLRSEKVELLRKMRREPTESERALIAPLAQLGFQHQVIVNGWIPDFYRADLKIAIEIDGEVHEQEWRKSLDKIKDEDLRSIGVTVMRFRNATHPNFILGKARTLVHAEPPSKPQGKGTLPWERKYGSHLSLEARKSLSEKVRESRKRRRQEPGSESAA